MLGQRSVPRVKPSFAEAQKVDSPGRKRVFHASRLRRLRWFPTFYSQTFRLTQIVRSFRLPQAGHSTTSYPEVSV